MLNISSSTTQNFTLLEGTTYQYSIKSNTLNPIYKNTNITLSQLTFKSGFYSKNISQAFTIIIKRNSSPFLYGSIGFNILPNTLTNQQISLSNNTVQK